MNILFVVLAFVLGVTLGTVVSTIIMYRLEKRTVDELMRNCADARKKLEELTVQETSIIESMWPKRNPYVSSVTNVADYLKEKYLSDEEKDE